jgi:hypothetical protein
MSLERTGTVSLLLKALSGALIEKIFIRMMHLVDLPTGRLAPDGICKMKIPGAFREVLRRGIKSRWMLNDRDECLMRQDVLSSQSHMRVEMD